MNNTMKNQLVSLFNNIANQDINLFNSFMKVIGVLNPHHTYAKCTRKTISGILSMKRKSVSLSCTIDYEEDNYILIEDNGVNVIIIGMESLQDTIGIMTDILISKYERGEINDLTIFSNLMSPLGKDFANKIIPILLSSLFHL